MLFRHRSLRAAVQGAVRGPVLLRRLPSRLSPRQILSLGLMTGLGWSLVNSGVIPPVFHSVDSGVETTDSRGKGGTSDLSHLQPLPPFHPVALPQQR